MKISLILAHPSSGSFNHAIAAAAASAARRAGHEVVFHDLQHEEFPAILSPAELQKNARLHPRVEVHCAEIAVVDGIIIVHPNWWGMPPAILKGWIDRVLRPEVAYRFETNDKGEGVPVGLLRARTAVVFNTANTPDHREMECFGDPLETLWKKCVFDLCGVREVYRRTFSVIVTSSPAQRAAWLNEVRETVVRLFPSADRTQESACESATR